MKKLFCKLSNTASLGTRAHLYTTPKAWQRELDELKKSAEVDRARVEKLGDDVAVMETLIYNVQRLTNYEEKHNEIQRRRTAELE